MNLPHRPTALELLPAETLARLRKLELLARGVVEAHDANDDSDADEEGDAKEAANDPVLKEALAIAGDLATLSPGRSGATVAVSPMPH